MCSRNIFLLIIEDDDPIKTQDTREISNAVENETKIEETYFQPPLEVFIWRTFPKTLKFKRLLDGLFVIIIVNIDNTRNILQPRIA